MQLVYHDINVIMDSLAARGFDILFASLELSLNGTFWDSGTLGLFGTLRLKLGLSGEVVLHGQFKLCGYVWLAMFTFHVLQSEKGS